MHNELFTIGPVTVYGYGLMIAIGIIAAYLLAEYRARKIGLNDEAVFGLACWAVVGGLLGGKILYYITTLPAILADPSLLYRDLAYGFVIYGSLIGGVAGVVLYCWWKKLNCLSYFDLAVPSVALAQGFGRIGCQIAGCCYGKETSGALHIVFHGSDYAPNGVPLIPTQIISSGLNFIHFAILLVFAKKYKKGEGQVAGLFFILYSAGRFVLEFMRGDMERGNVGILSTSQFISLFMFAFGWVLFFVLGKMGRTGGRKVAAAVSIIGGADGPTSLFLAGKSGDDSRLKAKHEKKMRRIADKIPTDPHTLEEVEQYLQDKYHAVCLDGEREETRGQERAMRSTMVFKHRPELLRTPEPEVPKPDDPEALKQFEEQIKKRFQEAEEVSAEEFPLDFHCYQITPEGEEDTQLIINVERRYQELQVSYTMGKSGDKAALEAIVKDVYLYYGVSQEDKEKCTERFMVLANVLELL